MVPRKLRALKILGLCILLLLSFLISGALAWYIEGFESGTITSFWVKEQAGTGNLTVTTGAAKWGNYGLNATSFGGGSYWQFIWTDNFTSGPASYNYMGYWLKLDPDYKLADTKSVYVSSMWNENYTLQYIHIKNSSGSLRWYPNGGPVCGPAISLDTWYWVINGYYINKTGAAPGWFAVWADTTGMGTLISNTTADTSYWGITNGISVGILMTYGTGSDGGSIFFDKVCHDSSFTYGYENGELIDYGTWPIWVGFIGILFLVAGPMYIVYETKHSIHDFPDALAWGILCIFIGLGLVIVWLE